LSSRQRLNVGAGDICGYPIVVLARAVPRSHAKALLRAFLSDNVGCELIFEKCQTILKEKLSFLEPLNLQPVTTAKMEKSLDRGVKIAMLLP
jgi:hypothetical protein